MSPITADWLILDAIRYPPSATKRSRLIWNSGDVKRLSIVIYLEGRVKTFSGFSRQIPDCSGANLKNGQSV
jgi:hypothetical protein